ncbi:thioredoxin family protein [Thalassotalea piscium]
MKTTYYIPLLMSLLILLTPQSFAMDNIASELPLYSKIYDDERDPFKDAVAAIALAQKTQRNVLIEIGGNWCSWCHKMDAFLAKNPDVYQALHNKYVLLKVSVSDVNENEAFMKSLPPVLGYPHMYVSTNSGKMMLSKDTAELLEGDYYSKNAWLTFLDQWQYDKNAQNLLNMKTE